jgi:hypothetical protein
MVVIMRKFLCWMFGLSHTSASAQEFSFPQCPVWSAEDAAHWRTFLGSPTGNSLWKRARAMQIASCVNACDGKLEPKLAGGISFTLNWMEQLATISESPAASGETYENSKREIAVPLESEFSH